MSLIQSYNEFKGEEPFELAQLIDDAVLALSGIDISQAPVEAETETYTSQPAVQAQPTTRRRKRKKIVPIDDEVPPVEIDDPETEDFTEADITGYAARSLSKAANKQQFIAGYNAAATDASSDDPAKRDMSRENTDYIDGYEYGYKEFSGEIKEYDASYDLDGRPSPKELLKQQEAAIKINRSQFGDPDLPAVLRLIPELYIIIKELGFKLEVDRYNAMMAGDSIAQADKNIRQIFGISHLESFIIWNMKKPFFNKSYALRSIKKHLSVIFDNKYRNNKTRIFKKGFVEALVEDEMTETTAFNLLSHNFVDKILDDVDKYDYEPDKWKKLNTVLITNFASLTVYATGTAAGPGGTKKATAKDYQGNTSKTFGNRVKEEYREVIIADFLARLKEKFLGKASYRIASGRKDPNNPSRLEYYKFTAEEVKGAAVNYANGVIDKALANQAAGKVDNSFNNEDEEESGILDDEYSPEAMTDQEISQKLSNTTDFQTLAPFFGFSGAPGMRQWFLKFAKRFFEMGIISSKSGDRTLITFHSQMVEAVLQTLSENLPELATEMMQDVASLDRATKDSSEQSRMVIADVILKCAKQIDEAWQTFLDVGDDLHSTIVSGKSENGEVIPIPFLDSLGGQLTRSVNGIFFKKVLTKLDKSWTDYVAEQLQTNKQFQNYIADNIAQSVNIDAKAAKSVAEYFIGKKTEPTILTNRGSTKRVYKSAAAGNPTKGVKTLLKYGIDADAYHIIKLESEDWFEDMLMTDFAKVVDFKGQYRVMILKDYKNLGKNSQAFKAVVLKSLNDVIKGSEERMAMDSLKDYEVKS